MIKTPISGSIGKKYVTGYLMMGLFVAVLFLFSLAENRYISNRYRQMTEELVAINQLQESISALNNCVNLGYLYLSAEGLSQYEAQYDAVEKALLEIDEQQQREYLRELDDAGKTIETYMEKSNALISVLTEYMKKPKRESEVYTFLEAEYSDLQEVYTYTNQRFQDAYAAKLGTLSRMENEIEGMRTRLTFLQLSFVAAAILVCGTYIIRIIREMQESIRRMLRGVEEIREDVGSAKPIAIESGDEFAEFADAFNRMTEIIREQMRKLEDASDVKERLAALEIENLRIYSELQKSHLNFLQSRINPHFLFNTLNMISSLARMENADKCAELMETTAAFLRYNLDNISKTVTLEKELDNLRDYIAIQECRYGGRYQYEIQAEEDCLSFEMPCMILQPLVENAIQHGVAMMVNGGWIGVYIRKINETVRIEVRDNGIGMSKEAINAVYDNLQQNEAQSSHIGIGNIYRRLKLFYNNQVGFHLENRNPGLSIIISLTNS